MHLERHFLYIMEMCIRDRYKIGCVRGGADWEVVYKIIEEELKDYDVELWRLDE